MIHRESSPPLQEVNQFTLCASDAQEDNVSGRALWTIILRRNAPGMILIMISFFIVFSLTSTFSLSNNDTIDCETEPASDGLDLLVYYQALPLANCTPTVFTLVDLIAICASNQTNQSSFSASVTSMKVFHFCIHISIASLQPLLSIRRLLFQNCSIDFLASHMLDDYETYPKNLSRWSFEQDLSPRSNMDASLAAFRTILGPLKFDLTVSGCFRPIHSFDDFYPLTTQLILLNITCERFGLEEPLNSTTRMAIFLIPFLIINTEPTECPPAAAYSWLSFPQSSTSAASLRTLTCAGRVIQLSLDSDRTTGKQTIAGGSLQTMPSSTLTSTFSSASKSWTWPMIVNVTVLTLSTMMLCFALSILVFRFVREKFSKD